MTFEQSEQPNHTPDQILAWPEDSVSSFIPSGFDDPCFFDELFGYQWWEWDQTQEPGQDPIHSYAENPLTNIDNNHSTNYENNDQAPEIPIIHPNPPPPPPPPPNSQPRKRNALVEEFTAVKRSSGNRKVTNKSRVSSCNDGRKEGRWAEQLLNPCATAIMEGNSSRVQHYLCVLHELASSTGDTNYRLAAYGLRALTHHLSSPSASARPVVSNFASVDPRTFQQSLMKFYEVSPWFAFPNNMANSAILQILAQEPDKKRGLRILDIGVSHGMQWPTLLEALTRRPEGPPSKVHITVISNIENDQNTELPFSIGPPGHNYSSQLLSFARSLNINLQISKLDNYPLQNLSSPIINSEAHETLIVCGQFRLHQLNHNSPDERTAFLKALRSLEPKGVILCENNTECSCSGCNDFTAGFSKKLEHLWKFLDSTSSGFKDQDSEERKIMEGEAAKALVSRGEMNEGKEKWYERMRETGFDAEVFEEDSIDRARALLRKYDSNWEMRVEDGGTSVGIWWKGEAVSFCSVWKMSTKVNND